MGDVYVSAGMSGLFGMAVNLLGIYLAWIVLQEIKLDAILKQPKSRRAAMFQVMLAIVLGHAFADFVLDYWEWSQMLRFLVE